MSAISVGKEMEKDVSVAKLFLMESPPGIAIPTLIPRPIPSPIPNPIPNCKWNCTKVIPLICMP